jgi:hypothetical protein
MRRIGNGETDLQGISIVARELCNFCHGNSDTCPHCDGGWISTGPTPASRGGKPRVVAVTKRVKRTAVTTARRSPAKIVVKRSRAIDPLGKYAVVKQSEAKLQDLRKTFTTAREFLGRAQDTHSFIERAFHTSTDTAVKSVLEVKLHTAARELKNAERRAERSGKGAIVWQTKVGTPKPTSFIPKAELQKIAAEKAAANIEKREAKAAKAAGLPKKKMKKPKKRSVWTISGGGIETNHRRH